MKINNSDVCKIVANKAGVKVVDVEELIGMYYDSLTEALLKGDEVLVKGFGVYDTKQTKDREGVDPRTGEKREYKGRRLPKFKFSANYQNKF